MYARDGNAACLDEGGTEGRLLVNAVAVGCKTLAHDVGFQGEVASQTGIATTDYDEAVAIVTIDLEHHFHGTAGDVGSLFARHGACVGEDVEERLLILKGFTHMLLVPLGDEQTAVNGLNACRVVVENDHFNCAP